MQRRLLSLFFSKLSLTIFGCLISLSVEAQVIPDGTTSTTVNQDGNNFTIEQGDRVGDNLFHSFNQFSLPTLGSAAFNNAGDIAINTPDIDPTSGLIELPASVGDASDQISQNPCEQGVGSEFIVTGKGGLPPNVNESLNSESAQVGLIEAVTAQQQTVEGNNIHSNPSTTSEAVPAQGWIFNDNGEVTLTAYSTSGNKTQRSEQQHSNTCSSGIAP
jgi:large exoprotein involved in heme utilization and adhesion